MQSRGWGSTLLKMIWKKTQGWSEYQLIKAIYVVLYVCSALLIGFDENILIQTFFFYLVQLDIVCHSLFLSQQRLPFAT